MRTATVALCAFIAGVQVPRAMSESEVEGLLKGEGMGQAKAAEMNRYPGPRHVLDRGEELRLTPRQREIAERLVEEMRVRSIRAGKVVVAKERALDALFSGGKATDSNVARLVREIAVARGEARLAHLRAHLALRPHLSKAQIAEYMGDR